MLPNGGTQGTDQPIGMRNFCETCRLSGAFTFAKEHRNDQDEWKSFCGQRPWLTDPRNQPLSTILGDVPLAMTVIQLINQALPPSNQHETTAIDPRSSQ